LLARQAQPSQRQRFAAQRLTPSKHPEPILSSVAVIVNGTFGGVVPTS
jgi:hypothetical protein